MIESLIIGLCAGILGGMLGSVHRRVRNIERLLNAQISTRIPEQRREGRQ